MKYTCLFLTILLISSTQAVELRSKAKSLSSSDLASNLASLENSKMGSMIKALAELHLATGGPIEELAQAIEELVNDLNENLRRENEQWDQTTNLHNSRVEEYNLKIEGAKSDISHENQKLNDALYPLREQLKNEIETLKQRIAENEETTRQESEQRAREHKDFVEKQAEHNDAVAAVDEAVSLVKGLANAPSLIQINKAKNSLMKISKKIGKKVTYSPIIKALTQLAMSQNFSDQVVVSQILDLLNRLKDNLVTSLAERTQNEENAQTQWEARHQQLVSELQTFNDRLAAAQVESQRNDRDIENSLAFIESRTNDLHENENRLAEENSNYDTLTKAHNELVTQFNSELTTVGEAVKLLQSINTRDYLKERANKELF